MNGAKVTNMFPHRAVFSLTSLRPYLSAALCENAALRENIFITFASFILSVTDLLLKLPSPPSENNRKIMSTICYRIFGRKQNEPFCYQNMTARKQIEPICSRIEPIWTCTTKHENIGLEYVSKCFQNRP